MWQDAAQELGLHGRCIIYDRRGFHRSGPPVPFETLDLVERVDDAAAVLAALHAGPEVVIGGSTGGLIAIELARRFPDKVKALVLLEPALFTIVPEADTWARNLRSRVLERAAGQPGGAGIRRPALTVSAEDSPEACRFVNSRLSGALPFTHTVLVPGGHLINPAHPAVLDFVDRIAAGTDSWT